MPLWLHVAAGVLAGAVAAFGLLVAFAWLAALAVRVVDRLRLRR